MSNGYAYMALQYKLHVCHNDTSGLLNLCLNYGCQYIDYMFGIAMQVSFDLKHTQGHLLLPPNRQFCIYLWRNPLLTRVNNKLSQKINLCHRQYHFLSSCVQLCLIFKFKSKVLRTLLRDSCQRGIVITWFSFLTVLFYLFYPLCYNSGWCTIPQI